MGLRMEDRRWKIGKFGAALLALAMWMSPVMLVGDGVWEVARADYAWSFPEDHWARDGYKTEWWYFTGHLESESGQAFAYQFTFFRVGLLRERPDVASGWGAKDLIMGHLAMTEMPYGLRGGSPSGEGWGALRLRSGQAGARGRKSKSKSAEHRFSEVLYRAVPLLGGFGTYPDSLVAWSRGPAGTDGIWELRWNGEGFDFSAMDDGLGISLELSTRPEKGLILQGPNGYSRKGEGTSAASQYYSFTRLATKGTVSIDGQVHSVTGQSWMDKEFFTNSMADGQVGWDWFSLQLNDDREVMLYVLRDGEGKVSHARGTLVEADGSAQFLEQDGFVISTTETWVSPTGDAYPSGWTLRVPAASLDMTLHPKSEDQENRSTLIPTLRYWEGAVEVRDGEGREIGVGFIEMTGYGSATTPAM
jgi:predicted secreted hydrolase